MVYSMSTLLLLLAGSQVSALRNPQNLVMKASLQADWAIKTLKYLEKKPILHTIKPEDEMKAMREADVSRADNFYESTMPNILRQRTQSAKEMDPEKRIKLDENFYDLMNIGFNKRLSGGKDSLFLPSAAKKAAFHLELGKSKSEQLIELKKERLQQRSGFVKMLPEASHKYFDYLNSLYIKPVKSDIVRNLSLGAFFSMIIFANRAIRSGFMFANVAQMMLISTMLTRNIPEEPVQPGMGRRRVATWSGNAFRTAVGIALFYYVGAFALVGSLVSIFPIPFAEKFKAALMASTMASAYYTTFYEVYEEKGKGGWRWKKSLEGTSISDVDALIVRNSKETKMTDAYDYAYDPMIDEFPPQQIYIDEIPGQVVPPSAGDMDEGEWRDHYDSWKRERKDARRAPIVEAPPETPWVGGKAGMYVKKVPNWIGSAYKQSVLGMNKWRGKKPKHERDISEFQPIEGPLGFRDKSPEWLGLFGSGVWEETGTASKKAARSYGTYRKCMWKLDKKIVLQKCDE
jgi:hypothetical protein